MPAQRPQTLIDRLQACSVNEFPRGLDYSTRFRAIADYVANYAHSVVTLGAANRDGSTLTGHGREHIRTLHQRAEDLLSLTEDGLSCLEIYMLLVAAELHDVGNALGRTDHQQVAWEVIAKGGPLFGDDAPEKRLIGRIAAAHGGKIGDDKDTISDLPERDYILSFPVRPRMVAAILRFADELADDSSRAARFLMDNNAIVRGSEVHHSYALSLRSPVIAGDTIMLKYDLNVSDVVRKLGKESGECFLLDEIFERVQKMDMERMYCLRFLRGILALNKIDVVIDIFRSEQDSRPSLTLNFRLEEAGYPSRPSAPIACSCNGKDQPADLEHLDGAALANFFLEDQA